MLYGVDISSHQGKEGFTVDKIASSIDFVIVKATGGTGYVDRYCDRFIEQAKRLGKLWGFYHFAHDLSGQGSAIIEADFFVDNTLGYYGGGIPILDWERDSVSVAWVNAFCDRVYGRTRVRPWIYANPWRFQQGGVKQEYSRWVAKYPLPGRPTLQSDPGNAPAADGLVCAWQYSAMGDVPGWAGYLDLNHYYGDRESWMKYANGDRDISTDDPPIVDNSDIVVEDNDYRVTIEKK